MTIQTVDNLRLKESGYERCVIDASEWQRKEVCLRLRHQYFVKHRRWISCNGTGEETDHYDPSCQHLAVFQNDHILAYMRLLPWQPHTGFMLEHDFACLLSDEERSFLIHDHSAELSRLVIAPRNQCDASHTLLGESPTINSDSSMTPLPISNVGITDTHVNTANEANGSTFGRLAALYPLFKLFFHTARQQKIETFYIVVEPSLLKIMQRKFGIPFVPLGKPYVFPDGTVTQAAFTTLADTERSIAAKFPLRYAWYQQSP